MTVVLRLDGVARRRGSGAQAFTIDVEHLEVRAGELVALGGPSGSGKSTLLDLVGLVSRPDRAAAFAMGKADVAALWAKGGLDGLAGIRAKRIGYVLQTGGLLPFLSVRDNMALSCRLTGGDEAVVAELAAALGLERHLGKMPAELSIGERQRAAIGRALAHRPALILADEPTASLDPDNARVVMALFTDLVRQFGAAAIVASHDRAMLDRHADRRIEPSLATGPEGEVAARFAEAA